MAQRPSNGPKKIGAEPRFHCCRWSEKVPDWGCESSELIGLQLEGSCASADRAGQLLRRLGSDWWARAHCGRMFHVEHWVSLTLGYSETIDSLGNRSWADA